MSHADIKNGWFEEREVMWPGQRFSLKVKELIHHEKSKFQDILLFQSENYGRVLVLDGVIQCTELDECSYQEMGVNLALCCHPDPKKVLVIGGGDGGMVREIARHPGVTHIHQCELDERVVEVSKKYLPSMSSAFSDPRFELFVRDGSEFLVQPDRKEYYDCIIVDSSDPVGPAETLFTGQFFARLRRALKPDGIAVTQAECPWIHADIIGKILRDNKKAGFSSAQYAWFSIPTYPCGTIGFSVLSNKDCSSPARSLSADVASQLKFYSSEMHKAAFALPPFLLKAIDKAASEEPSSKKSKKN